MFFMHGQASTSAGTAIGTGTAATTRGGPLACAYEVARAVSGLKGADRHLLLYIFGATHRTHGRWVRHPYQRFKLSVTVITVKFIDRHEFFSQIQS